MEGHRRAILTHGVFAEIGPARHRADLGQFSRDSHARLLDIVAQPLTFYDDDVAAVMDEGNLEVIDRARSERLWFPEREFGLFQEGWAGIGWRNEAVRLAARRLSASERPDEHDLFTFFSNGVAAFESFAFAAYCAAAMLDSRNFPTRDATALRKVNPRSTVVAFAKVHPSARVTRLLRDFAAAREYTLIVQIRNTLSHRASPTMLVPDQGWPVSWLTGWHGGPNVELTPELIERLADWVTTEMEDLVVALEEFAADRWSIRGYSRLPS